MKSLLLMLSLVSFQTQADTIEYFNRALQEDIKKETPKEENFKQTSSRGRAPASVPSEAIKPELKINKKDRQLGTQKW
jgi:hypothetical protein